MANLFQEQTPQSAIDPWITRSAASQSAIARLIRTLVPKRFRPIGYIEHLVNRRTGGRVKGGPFAGTKYIYGAVGSAYVPKLLGIYERELNEYVEQACSLHPKLIVDIGAAEGYYAIGLALRNPDATVIAFEMEEKGQDALKEMANMNNVASRVDVRGKCEVAELQAVLKGAERALIICDVEGDEEKLLNPEIISELCRAHLLVEMHDFIHPGVSDRVIDRFTKTHEVRRIWQEPRSHDDIPYRTLGTAFLPSRYLDWAVSEWRPERMSWLWMEPRNCSVR